MKQGELFGEEPGAPEDTGATAAPSRGVAPRAEADRAPLSGAVEAPPAGEDAVVFVHAGARATERALLEDLDALERQALADPALLAQPVRVVVPSRRLREHLCERLVAGGRGRVGVVVQTVWQLAFEIVDAAHPGGAEALGLAGGRRFAPILARRYAREEPTLSAPLDALVDGYGVVVAAVTDLLDAGLEPALEPAILEAAAQVPRAPERAVALVRVALRVLEDLAGAGLHPRGDLYRRAADALRAGQGLRARALRIHGFADATGVLSELLAALARLPGARVLLDHPPDPAEGSAGPGPAFTQRLREHLALAEHAAPPGEACEPPTLRLTRSAGAEAEARAAAWHARTLLDDGVAPERIAIVARDLTPYRAVVADHLRRLGVPFSGGSGFGGPEARRVSAWLELLDRGPRCTVDRWLDAQGDADVLAQADLRLALHGIGVGRLRDLAKLDVEGLSERGTTLPLPVRRGLPSSEGEAETPVETDPDVTTERVEVRGRRRIGLARLAAARDRARTTLAQLEGLGREASVADHVGRLRTLLAGPLGHGPGASGLERVQGALSGLEADLGSARVAGDELGLLLRPLLEGTGREALGGQGAGVRLLDATEARGATFEHLVVIGLNRDVFPRAISEDPLLPDDARRALLAVLPELPVKGRGADEERYLFAQLCSAAPQVLLSRQGVSDEGKERAPSPLLERLRLVASLETEALPGVLEGPSDWLRTPSEHAMRAGAAGDRSALGAALAVIDGEPLAGIDGEPLPGIDGEPLDSEGIAGADAAARARVRLAQLHELDPPPGSPTHRRLGAYFGLVGAEDASSDYWVTRLEGFHYCPWRTFLEKRLRIEPVPDALAALPDVTPALLGNAVHRALERLVLDAGGAADVRLDEARAKGPVDVPFPDRAGLRGLAREVAAEVARDEGIVLPGFSALVAEQVVALLTQVRERDGEGGRLLSVLGAELEACADLGAVGLPGLGLRFRADRVDLRGDGLVLTDYKTGKPLSEAKRPAKRREHLIAGVRSGKRLQAAAYALASDGGEGRYAFLGEAVEADHARVTIEAHDEEVARALGETVEALVAAWRDGAFVPRLLRTDGQEGPACGFCEVREACLQGDSGARGRLLAWLRNPPAHPQQGEAEALALLGQGAGS